MATHSSILTWRVPSTEEPDCLWSMESQSTGHGLVTNTYTLASTGYLVLLHLPVGPLALLECCHPISPLFSACQAP